MGGLIILMLTGLMVLRIMYITYLDRVYLGNLRRCTPKARLRVTRILDDDVLLVLRESSGIVVIVILLSRVGLLWSLLMLLLLVRIRSDADVSWVRQLYLLTRGLKSRVLDEFGKCILLLMRLRLLSTLR